MNKVLSSLKSFKYPIFSIIFAFLASFLWSNYQQHEKKLNILLEGIWSTNIEDVVNNNDYDINVRHQPLIIMELHADKYG